MSNDSWQQRLRVHSALVRHLLIERMPWQVYCQFHVELQLGTDFAFNECLDSWVRGTECDSDLAETYSTSEEYCVLESRQFRCVYRKTDFVVHRLHVIAQEARKVGEEAEKQRAAAELETLNKSRFETFLYLMEDLRNGAIKIGQSKTPCERERTLQSEVPEVRLRLSIPADQAHERQLHLHFDAKRLRGEWFSLTADDVFWLVSFLRANGDASRCSADYEWLGRLLLQSDRQEGEGPNPLAPITNNRSSKE